MPMEIHWFGQVLVGIEATARPRLSTPSLVEAFEEGRVGAGACDPRSVHESFLDWINHNPEITTRNLLAVAIHRPTADDECLPWKIIFGEIVKPLDIKAGEERARLDLAILQRARRNVGHILQEWQQEGEPGLILTWFPSGPPTATSASTMT